MSFPIPQFSYFSLCDVLPERLALLGVITLLEVYPAALCIFFITLKIKKWFTLFSNTEVTIDILEKIDKYKAQRGQIVFLWQLLGCERRFPLYTLCASFCVKVVILVKTSSESEEIHFYGCTWMQRFNRVFRTSDVEFARHISGLHQG